MVNLKSQDKGDSFLVEFEGSVDSSNAESVRKNLFEFLSKEIKNR